MKILFEVFKYNDDYYKKIKSGIISEDDECDFDKDCYKENILFDTNSISIARPSDNKKYSEITNGDGVFYIVNVPFNDLVKIIPHNTYVTMKQKWAN